MRVTIPHSSLDLLFQVLTQKGYQLLGPTLRDGAIVYDEISSSADLPIGWTDHQEAGYYRLKKRKDEALFGYAVSPHSWKKFLYPPILKLFQAARDGNSFQASEDYQESKPYALIGARSCELKAIAIQDRVFLEGAYVGPIYQKRRQNIFVVALNCSVAGGTCFCVSMKTGPKVSSGFDLALTEIIDRGGHRFLVEVGSQRGEEVLRTIAHDVATESDIAAATQIVEQTAKQMGRSLDTTDIKELLYRNLEHPRWDDVAARCLTCANCTMVCPTCFCSTVEDTADLTGEHAEQTRKWDSCFTLDFSYIHGGSIRTSTRSRYRQWLTHKLATWIDQFGTSGCVGCGRCITWCPVGIDITEEVKAIRESEDSS